MYIVDIYYVKSGLTCCMNIHYHIRHSDANCRVFFSAEHTPYQQTVITVRSGKHNCAVHTYTQKSGYRLAYLAVKCYYLMYTVSQKNAPTLKRYSSEL